MSGLVPGPKKISLDTERLFQWFENQIMACPESNIHSKGFGCLEVCLYGIKELISTNQSAVYGWIWTNEIAALPDLDMH